MSGPARLSHLGTDGRDQWARVLRWHTKLARIRAALPDVEPAKSEALDDVWAFFENCFHLADWVVKAGVKTKQEVDNFIDRREEMRLCRDVANGVKHYRLDPARRTTTDAEWSTATRYDPVVITGTGSRIVGLHPPRWVFTTDHGDRDMFEVADECVAAWAAALRV